MSNVKLLLWRLYTKIVCLKRYRHERVLVLEIENNILQHKFQVACETMITCRSNSVIYDFFTCDINSPVWRHCLECQCDVINIKNFHEIFRYLCHFLSVLLNQVGSLKKIMVQLKRVFSKLLFFSSVLALFYNLLLQLTWIFLD